MSDQKISSRTNNFDFLRFLAATLVIFYHSTVVLTGSDQLDFLYQHTNGVLTIGKIAVDTFFVISGFLIAKSWVQTKDVVLFLCKRLLRIYPGLATVLLLTVFVLGPLVTTLPSSVYFQSPVTYIYLRTLFLHPVYGALPGVFEHNPLRSIINGSLWTLEYEMICYLLLMTLGLCKLLNKYVVAVLFIILMLVPVQQFSDWWWYNFVILTRFFTAGTLCYLFWDNVRFNVALIGISVCSLILGLFFNELFYYILPICGSYLLFAFAFSKKIRWYNFAKFGDFSYGLYIYAFPIQQLLVLLFHNKLSHGEHFVLSYILALICAFLSWHLVEKRLLLRRLTT